MIYRRLKEKWQNATWDKKVHYVIVVTVTTIFIILYLRAIYRYDYKFKHEPVRYTIGRIFLFRRNLNVGPWFEYKYIVNAKQYKGKYSIESKLAIESNDSLKKYLLKSIVPDFGSITSSIFFPN